MDDAIKVGLILAWIIVCVLAVVGYLYFVSRRAARQKERAYREIMAERGVEQKPGESLHQALARTVRKERESTRPKMNTIPDAPEARARK